MTNNQIYILSGPIRTGKTTTVSDWLVDKKSVAGILTPDQNSLRMLIDIQSNRLYQFELDADAEKPKITIGKFNFDESVFEVGRKILEDLCRNDISIIVIDEIGKLELSNSGFEPELTNFIAYHLQSNVCILLIVRDTLLTDVIQKYNLQKATILDKTALIENCIIVKNE